MRKILGVAVVVICMAGLWVFTAQKNARALTQSIDEQAQSIISRTVHTAKAEVKGRDIHLTGIADSEAERDSIRISIDAIEGRGEVIDALEILPRAKPFTLAATRKSGKTLLQGNVPTEEMRQVLQQSGAVGADGLTLASGAPDRWESAIGAGLAALSKMDEGSVSLNGSDMRLTGLVDLPSDRETLIAALTLPEGFTLQNEIETRDDGLPVAYKIRYTTEQSVVVEGKLPKGLAVSGVGEALGVQNISGTAKPGLQGDGDSVLTVLTTLSARLAELDSATLSFAEDKFQLDGLTQRGIDALALQNQLQNQLNADLDTQVTVTLTPAFSIANFNPNLQTCTAQTEHLLASLKISFVSGSPSIAPESARGINALADIMGRCVRLAGLTAELGGHTDDRGSGNYELSAARAQVVRAAMIARGVPGEAMSAVGFGPSKPIADNANEEGRAANRRMTVLWAP